MDTTAKTPSEATTLNYEIKINATAEKVYEIMLDKEHYKTWTVPFSPTSAYEGSWEKGSKIMFTSTEENGEKAGMISSIAENVPGVFVSIRHIGMLKGNQEITSGPEVENWADATENYTYIEDNGSTLLKVELTGIKEYQDYFEKMWPLALKALKDLVEEKK